MVLSDASTPDLPPSSSPDPYSSSPSTIPLQSNHYIDPNLLPRPIPILGPIFGYTGPYFAKTLQAQITQTTTLIRRPLTEPEVDAIAFWTAKTLSIGSYGRPLGLVVGLVRAWQTRATWRLPFVNWGTPAFVRDEYCVKVGEQVLVSARAVRALCHGLRASVYGSLGIFVGGVVVGGYAATVGAGGEMQDRRLGNMTVELRGALERVKREGGRPLGGRGGGLPTGRRESADAAAENEGQDWEGADNQGPGSESDGDRSGGQELARLDASGMEDRVNGMFQTEKAERKPRSFDDDYDDDDASPTTTTPTKFKTSTWDRIRRDGPKSTAKWAGVRKAEQEKKEEGEGFAYDGAAEERALAKSEAQREFDKMVERERKGGEAGGERRW